MIAMLVLEHRCEAARRCGGSGSDGEAVRCCLNDSHRGRHLARVWNYSESAYSFRAWGKRERSASPALAPARAA